MFHAFNFKTILKFKIYIIKSKNKTLLMVLIIKPISAQLISDKDLLGKSDPYCVITIGSQNQRTKTHNGAGKTPQWQQTLQFNSQDAVMKVQVFDDDWGKDDLIGQGSVNLNQLYSMPNRTQNQYVDLICNGKTAGRVLISMQYQGPPMGGNMNTGYGGQQQQGWGNQPQQGQGWGNQPQQGQGWGNQPQQGQGWGNQPQQGQGWGNQPQQGQGWGNQPQQGQGWGNQPQQGQGWGNQPQQGQQGWGNNNGW